MHVIFCHGKLSSPRATKIGWLRPLAKARDHSTEAPDFRGLDVDQRLKVLEASLAEAPSPSVVVGSSMGGAIAVFAARQFGVRGLFLMAPAVYFPGYEHRRHKVEVPVIHIVQGWRDEICMPAMVIRFAEEHAAHLTMVDDGHELGGSKAAIIRSFEAFLDDLEGGD